MKSITKVPMFPLPLDEDLKAALRVLATRERRSVTSFIQYELTRLARDAGLLDADNRFKRDGGDG
jgi:hypothetical protein